MKRTEDKRMRTASRKVFENQDHSRTVEIYLEPVHYQDLDGAWKEMDDTLEEVGVGDRSLKDGNNGFRNRKGSLEICLDPAAQEVHTVSLNKENMVLSWGAGRLSAGKRAETGIFRMT